MKIHWSFDYSRYQGNFSFEDILCECLRESAGIEYPQSYCSSRKEFLILPNYWGGYSTHKENYQMEGKVILNRHWKNNEWKVEGCYQNTDSCEKYTFCYGWDNGLKGSFINKIENSHRDLNQELEIHGLIDENKLTIHTKEGTPLVESKPLIRPLHSSWCLLEQLPTQPFDCLGNLENHYEDMKLHFLEEYELEGHKLRGYAMYGNAQPLVYYWINTKGHVVVAAHSMMTYVLKSAEFAEVN